MKILLTTLNSKFIHANLGLRYLRAACPKENILLREYTINDRRDVVAGDIYKIGADLIGFACYIWNISETLEIIKVLRKVAPQTKIVLGGPEVSYDPADYLQWADYVVVGEGEETFSELIACLKSATDTVLPEEKFSEIKGLAYNASGGPVVNPARGLIKDLGQIPSPYNELDGLENKIAYVESSRGCPFNCQYCLSSTFQGVRFFPLERTKEELQKLISLGIKQIKFVDRTFNCNKQHALEVMGFIKEWNPQANFHFEISADLLDEEILGFLSDVPKGLFQFEVGVQSTNQKTLELIDRKADLAKLESNVRAVSAGKHIRQLLDLIAGLPEEDYASFRNSFNEVYSWGPDKLHLGFLKMLKGSGIRGRSAEWSYQFGDAPPYQVLSNKWLDFAEILRLQNIEDMLDKYFNSSRFSHSLEFLVKQTGDAFGVFEGLAAYWEEQEYHRQAHNYKVLYQIFWEFYEQTLGDEIKALFAELLKLDYLLQEKPAKAPEWFPVQEPPLFKERASSFMHQGLLSLMPQLKELSKREISKYFHLESFSPEFAKYLNLPLIGEGEEHIYLLFYYPGQLLKADAAGYIPVVI